jgi:hypothetical protein
MKREKRKERKKGKERKYNQGGSCVRALRKVLLAKDMMRGNCVDSSPASLGICLALFNFCCDNREHLFYRRWLRFSPPKCFVLSIFLFSLTLSTMTGLMGPDSILFRRKRINLPWLMYKSTVSDT